MTARTQRRAAERKARKAEEKRLRHQLQNTAATAAIPTAPTPESERLAASLTAVSSVASVSEAQLAANRANAQFSRGPITERGKSISARNNFRHGLTQVEGDPLLLDSESQQDFDQCLADFEDEWQPATPTERILVSRLVTHHWLRRRALGLQRLFLHPEDGLITDEKQFNLYRRYEVQHERAFNKALSDLMRLRGLRLREQNGFESQRRRNEKHEYQIRHLKHREKLQTLAQLTAEARLALIQSREAKVRPAKPGVERTDLSAKSLG